jgi:aminocarboxymuconate-semialdehyde decarboxylase
VPKTVDAHAHILGEDTIRLLQKEAPQIGLKFTPIDKDFSVIEVAGIAFKPFPHSAWDMERRFRDLQAAEIDVQVLSNTPQTFLYDQDAGLAAATSALQNDQIAAVVRTHPERFLGLATLPMQAPERAADELRRVMQKLGMGGAQIGSNINRKNLDDPALQPFWATADELGAFLMVHPTQVAGADRMKSYYLTNLIGNPLDTTIAAACLVFGGVVERYPNIKFYMAHGGGFAPFQAGRWRHGWEVRPEPKQHLKEPPDASIKRLYFDSILHGQPALEFLVQTFGADHVLLGSDYPFDMGTLECARQVKALPITEADRQRILGGNADQLLASKFEP